MEIYLPSHNLYLFLTHHNEPQCQLLRKSLYYQGFQEIRRPEKNPKEKNS